MNFHIKIKFLEITGTVKVGRRKEKGEE